MGIKKLTEMEASLLGVAYRLGGATTYMLMKELRTSSLTWHRARAGTAYPMVTRLEAAGFLAPTKRIGTRGERYYAVTPEGEQAFLAWIATPPTPEEVQETVDLLRLRMFYLVSVEPQERRAVLDAALKSLRERLSEARATQKHWADLGGQFSALGYKGLVYETEARIRWLEEAYEDVIVAEVMRPPTPDLA